MSPEREKAMVAKKGKTTKKTKDMGARKLTSAQAKKVKGGIGSATGGAGSGRTSSVIGGGGLPPGGRKDWIHI
jgi:hypothetical protein